MSRKNGFYFWIGCKDVFVVTDRKNKTTHLAQQICEKWDIQRAKTIYQNYFTD